MPTGDTEGKIKKALAAIKSLTKSGQCKLGSNNEIELDSITGKKKSSSLQNGQTISVNFARPEDLPLPMRMMALSGKLTGQQTLKADGTFEDADLEKTHNQVKQAMQKVLEKEKGAQENPEDYWKACSDVLEAAGFQSNQINPLQKNFISAISAKAALIEEEDIETSKSHREGGFQVSGKTQAIFGTSIVGSAALVHPAILAALVIFLILPGALKQSQSVSKHTSRQRNNKDQPTPDTRQEPVENKGDTVPTVQNVWISEPQRGTQQNQAYNNVVDQLKSLGENPQAKLKTTGNRDDLMKAPTNEISGILKKTAKGNTTPTSDQLTQNLQNQQTLANTHKPLAEITTKVNEAKQEQDMPPVKERTKAFEETAQQSAKNQGKGQQGR